MQKVEIVGTSLHAEDFAKQGLSTVQEEPATIPMNQTSIGASQSVGYDPRYTDPLGRTFYVRATYMF